MKEKRKQIKKQLKLQIHEQIKQQKNLRKSSPRGHQKLIMYNNRYRQPNFILQNVLLNQSYHKLQTNTSKKKKKKKEKRNKSIIITFLKYDHLKARFSTIFKLPNYHPSLLVHHTWY